MIENVWAGFISAIQMLLISAGIFVAWGGGFMLRERSRDLQRTYRNALIALVCVVIALTLLTGMGNMVKAFVYWSVVIGVPLALGLGPTERAWQWLSQSDRGAGSRGTPFGGPPGGPTGSGFGGGSAAGSGFGSGGFGGGGEQSVGGSGGSTARAPSGGSGNGSAEPPRA